MNVVSFNDLAKSVFKALILIVIYSGCSQPTGSISKEEWHKMHENTGDQAPPTRAQPEIKKNDSSLYDLTDEEIKALYLKQDTLAIHHFSNENISIEQLEVHNPWGDIDTLIIDPIIVKRCTHKELEVLSFGTPDYMGRYSWQADLILTDDSLKRIQLPELFRKSSKVIEKYLNDQIAAEHQQILKSSPDDSCIKLIEQRTYGLDEFRIDFTHEQINFWVYLGTSSSCRNIDPGLAIMSYFYFDSVRAIGNQTAQ